MKTRSIISALIAASCLLGGCQTSTLKPESDNTVTATVEHPIFFGTTRFTVMLDGKTYAGVAGELREDVTGEQALRFGWQPKHKHFRIKQEMGFYFGTAILTAEDGKKLACDYLNHGDDWRLRCKIGDGKEIALYRVKSY